MLMSRKICFTFGRLGKYAQNEYIRTLKGLFLGFSLYCNTELYSIVFQRYSTFPIFFQTAFMHLSQMLYCSILSHRDGEVVVRL